MTRYTVKIPIHETISATIETDETDKKKIFDKVLEQAFKKYPKYFWKVKKNINFEDVVKIK